MTDAPRRVRRMRVASAMIVAGLSIEIATLHWVHPTAFLVFVGGAGLLIGVGVLLFLTTLFATGPLRQ